MNNSVVNLFLFIIYNRYYLALPAIEAVIREAIIPQSKAEMAIFDKMGLFSGANPPIEPKFIPIEPKLAKLQTA